MLLSLIFIERIHQQPSLSEKNLKKYCPDSPLRKFPHSGRALPEFPELPFREVIVAPYRFFYRVKEKTVWIVAVWHGAQLADEP
ncbi:MAG: type II toxin-antitoxin system RelE/ParE family toxin [bacterium]